MHYCNRQCSFCQSFRKYFQHNHVLFHNMYDHIVSVCACMHARVCACGRAGGWVGVYTCSCVSYCVLDLHLFVRLCEAFISKVIVHPVFHLDLLIMCSNQLVVSPERRTWSWTYTTQDKPCETCRKTIMYVHILYLSHTPHQPVKYSTSTCQILHINLSNIPHQRHRNVNP